MALWRAVIDDSGSDGSVFLPDFTKKPIDPMDGGRKPNGSISPVMSVGAVLVPDSFKHGAIREWTAFRARIAQRYGLTTHDGGLPKLHMRHLWWRRDEGKNPFFDLPFEDRKSIAREAYDLLDGLNMRHGVTFQTNFQNTLDFQESNWKFYQSEDGILDRKIIHRKFGRNKKNRIAEKFYNRITNPSMALVAGAILGFSEYCKELGDNGIITYDTSEASKGFDSEEIFDVLADLGWVTNLRCESHGSDDDVTFLQMADLMSFFEFRRALDMFRGAEGITNRDFAFVSRRIVNKMRYARPSDQKETDDTRKMITLHYLVGRHFLQQQDAAWVHDHMKTPAELFVEFEECLKTGAPGVALIKPASQATLGAAL